jgi:hypothetical protein
MHVHLCTYAPVIYVKYIIFFDFVNRKILIEILREKGITDLIKERDFEKKPETEEKLKKR